MSKQSPAFQFYPNDFLGGVVASYSLEEIGLYTVLLSFDWNLSGLPVEPEKLAKLSRCSLRKFRALWAVVGENFTERDGRYYNPRLQLERAKQEEWRRKSSEGGRKGAANRGSRVVEPRYQPNGNTPTPSQSSTPVTEEKRGADAPPPRIRVVHAPWVQEGVDWWVLNVGATTPAKFSKALSSSVALLSWERLFPDLRDWAAEKVRNKKPLKPEWYAEIASGRLSPKPEMVDKFGVLTEYGERMTRPVSA